MAAHCSNTAWTTLADVLPAAHAAASASGLQAKTTKKIVLRLACTVCKAQHMHAIKVRWRSQRAGSSTHAAKPGWQLGWRLVTCSRTAAAGLRGDIAHDRTPLLSPVPVPLQRCKHFEIGGDKKVKVRSMRWFAGALSSLLPQLPCYAMLPCKRYAAVGLGRLGGHWRRADVPSPSHPHCRRACTERFGHGRRSS